MKIISEQIIRSLGITQKKYMAWIYDSLNMKGTINVHRIEDAVLYLVYGLI